MRFLHFAAAGRAGRHRDRARLLAAGGAGARPGQVVVIEREALPRGLGIKLSPHQIDLQEVLALAELRGTLPREAVAIEPERVELGVGVSLAVERGLDALLERIAARLLAWGHTLATSRADAGGAWTAAEGRVGA